MIHINVCTYIGTYARTHTHTYTERGGREREREREREFVEYTFYASVFSTLTIIAWQVVLNAESMKFFFSYLYNTQRTYYTYIHEKCILSALL